MEIKARFPTPHGEAPALLRFEPGFRGTVLLYHGLGADKETQRQEASSLAEAGLLAVTVDAWGHGERRLANFDQAVDEPDAFARMVGHTVDEIPALIDTLQALLGPACGCFGVAGISMGGCIAFGAAVHEPRLAAVVPILGCPDWDFRGRGENPDFLRRSPHLHGGQVAPKALLAFNGGLDVNVPPGPTRDFMAALVPSYKDTPEYLQYVEYPESSHFMRESDWHDLWAQTVAWFVRWLR